LRPGDLPRSFSAAALRSSDLQFIMTPSRPQLTPSAAQPRPALRPSRASAVLVVVACVALAGPWARAVAAEGRVADFIVAVVNQELVTHAEVEQRLERVRTDAARRSAALPPEAELRQQIVDQLIDERAQLSLARESGGRIDEGDIDRAVAAIASQNGLSVPQLRERLQADGQDIVRFREGLRDQLMLERLREREIEQRLRIADAEIDAELARQREAAAAATQWNLGQLLVAVPEGADAQAQAQRRERAEQALARARAGEDFAALVREYSDSDKRGGGALGLRDAQRLPDLFVAAVKDVKAGEVAPALVRSGAGFHVLKVLERRDGGLAVTQQRARHILLRLDGELTREQALKRLAEFRQRIVSGQARFEDLAREHSADGSAQQGGDLGWAGPGLFVPEFERTLEALAPGAVAEPMVSRFGAHLIQLLERREVPMEPQEQRERARAALRERKAEGVYEEWAREVRARAYVEQREPPQ
jgi:peptidyl-prolyl cis-trans isomerase SurA